MHSPLDAHLHTPECNAIIKKLLDCHAENGKWKQWAFGTCEEFDIQMRKCTRQERIERIKVNKKAADTRNEELKAKFRKQNAEGKSWRDILDEKQK